MKRAWKKCTHSTIARWRLCILIIAKKPSKLLLEKHTSFLPAIERVMFVVSSYSVAMMLSLTKVHPERISRAVLLVPSGIAHGPMPRILLNMAIPFMKYYFHPDRKALQGIMDTMVSDGDDLWREFLDVMMTCYKMEMRPPREYKKAELSGFTSPILLIASPEDVFFPDYKVFPRADRIFSGEIRKMKITGKHLPSEKTMVDVCEAILEFDPAFHSAKESGI